MSQFMLFATEQELPGVFPPVFPIQPLAEQGTLLPPFPEPARHACLSSRRHLSLMLRCPLGMLARSRRVRQTATLHTRRSIADNTGIGMIE